MGRGDLTDAQWYRLAPLLPSQRPSLGRPSKDHRTIINGILWVVRTGAPWRDLPERYGPWPTVASVSTGGGERGCGSDSWGSCSSRPMPLASWSGEYISWMAPWSGPINMLLEPKGGRGPGSRPLPRGLWHQGSPACGREGQASGLRADPGSAA